MGLHYITFMGRNLDNNKKLTPVQIIYTSAGLNSKNIVIDVGTKIYSILSEHIVCHDSSKTCLHLSKMWKNQRTTIFNNSHTY